MADLLSGHHSRQILRPRAKSFKGNCFGRGRLVRTGQTLAFKWTAMLAAILAVTSTRCVADTVNVTCGAMGYGNHPSLGPVDFELDTANQKVADIRGTMLRCHRPSDEEGVMVSLPYSQQYWRVDRFDGKRIVVWVDVPRAVREVCGVGGATWRALVLDRQMGTLTYRDLINPEPVDGPALSETTTECKVVQGQSF